MEKQKNRREMEGTQSVWVSPSLQETATYPLDEIDVPLPGFFRSPILSFRW